MANRDGANMQIPLWIERGIIHEFGFLSSIKFCELKVLEFVSAMNATRGGKTLGEWGGASDGWTCGPTAMRGARGEGVDLKGDDQGVGGDEVVVGGVLVGEGALVVEEGEEVVAGG